MPKLLALIDGGRPVGEVVAEAARELAATGADPKSIGASALASIRLLVEVGFLVPATAASA
jgi:hypothetical protein